MGQIDELKNAPLEPQSAQALLENELKQALGAGSSSAPAVVNDLTGMVKRKKEKPAPETNGSGMKRKAEEVVANGDSKKARVEDVAEA